MVLWEVSVALWRAHRRAVRACVCSARREGKSARSGLCVTPRTWPEMGLVEANPRRALHPGCFSESPILLPGVPASHPASVPGSPHQPPSCHSTPMQEGWGGGRAGGWVACGYAAQWSPGPFRRVRAEKQDPSGSAGSAATCWEPRTPKQPRAGLPAINKRSRARCVTTHPAGRAIITCEHAGNIPGQDFALRLDGVAMLAPSPSSRGVAPGGPWAGWGWTAGERGEGGRGGPALQQLLLACDSPVWAESPSQSRLVRRGREGIYSCSWLPGDSLGRFRLLSPSPASAFPSARPAREEETRASRAQTPPPPPQLLSPPPATPRCLLLQATSDRPSLQPAREAETVEWTPTPAAWGGKSTASWGPWTPRPPRPSSGCPGAPARPSSARSSERATSLVGSTLGP
jgi:hypothetical protein